MYYEKTFLIISVLLGILFYPVNAQQRIVEGSNINISEVPWQVAIQTKGVFNGGGSILAPNLILTAAHVVEKYTAKEVKVGVGSSKYSNIGANWYSVSNIVYHPSLDIALLILSRPLSYSTNVKAIDILSANKASYYNVGNILRVTGWGITFLVIDDPFIGAANSFVITYDGKHSPSKGDSGGALTIWDSSLQRHVVIGTVHGNPSTQRAYCAYVRSSSFLDFLLPYYPISITGGSDQVCSSSTFSVSYPNSTVTWSCTGPLRITSQSNTSCTVSSTGNGPAVLKATIKSGK